MASSRHTPANPVPLNVEPHARALAAADTHPNHEARLLTIADVSAWLGVSKAWVYDHTTRKRPLLPCIRLGEMTRFRREDIERFIEEHTSGGSR
jgi:excisionase family DNA binding protein